MSKWGNWAMLLTFRVWLKRLLMLVVFLVLLVFFVNFTLANTQRVSLDVLGVMLPDMAVSTLVMGPFILGGLLGLTVSMVRVFSIRRANKKLSHKLNRRDNELQALRNSTLKGLTDA